MKKYAKLIIALGLAGGIMLTGCQKNESGSAEPTATPEPTEAAEEVTPEPTAMAAEEPEPTEDPIPDGYVVSYLTGEYVPEAIGRRRPVAVMLNNLRPACPLFRVILRLHIADRLFIITDQPALPVRIPLIGYRGVGKDPKSYQKQQTKENSR